MKSANLWTRIGLGAGLVVLLAGLTVALRNGYTQHNPGANDMLPRWVATRAWLLEGLSPYDPAIAARGQRLIYGRPATEPGEDLARFLYLPYAMLFFAGIALLPYDWAQAAWMTALVFSLLVVVLLSFRIHRWRPPPWLAALIAVWAVVVYPSARAVLLGQLSVVMVLLVTLAWWAIQTDRDVLAGAALALSTAKPTLAVLLLPALFAWSLAARRYRLALSLAITLVLLAAFSFVVAPDWPLALYDQAVAYTGYTEIGSVVNIVTHELIPFLGRPGELLLSAAALLWAGWAWWRARGGETVRFDYAFAVTIVVTLLVSPRTGTTSQPLLYPVLVMLLASAMSRRAGKQAASVAVALGVVAVGMWWLFLITVEGRVEQPPVFVPLPVGVAGALLLSGAHREREVAT